MDEVAEKFGVDVRNLKINKNTKPNGGKYGRFKNIQKKTKIFNQKFIPYSFLLILYYLLKFLLLHKL